MSDKQDVQERDGQLGRPLSRRDLLGGGAALAALGMAGPAGAKSVAHRVRRSSGSKMIGFSQPDTTASIWQPLMAGAQKAAKARGYQLLESHANSQLDAQVS